MALTNSAQLKIAIRTQQGITLLHHQDISYLEGIGRYTKIYLREGKPIVVAKLLKLFEASLSEDDFFRIHKSFLINMNSIKELKTNHKIKIVLENGTELEVAKRRRAELYHKLSDWLI
jgi:two-component system, LytTR family, response regulator